METPTLTTKPGTIVRSPVFPAARGIFIGVSPGGALWVAWRRCEAVTTAPDTAETWAWKARTMAARLDRLHARHVARLRLN
ncbi:MAG: hypothetical protein KAJ19_26985 [Gammaproteobacteria bacterium]|nr:hypothetical protein [Gammaproteobacteria bacterium]